MWKRTEQLNTQHGGSYTCFNSGFVFKLQTETSGSERAIAAGLIAYPSWLLLIETDASAGVLLSSPICQDLSAAKTICRLLIQAS